LADDDLPTGVVSGNTITFTSNRPGENFEVSWNRADNPDIIEATGAVNDPSGSASAVPNVSPFSIQKSLTYFMDMLSQNAAETSRLMKAQEHLENTIVSTEQAWGKMTDTDYAQASTEQVRASMKMEMANSIIGKSIRMNDLLVDLTTKHYRGAILNARA
jgi:flagellin-like hook-associated protein FlgL